MRSAHGATHKIRIDSSRLPTHQYATHSYSQQAFWPAGFCIPAMVYPHP